jgi:hypothetical protein
VPACAECFNVLRPEHPGASREAHERKITARDDAPDIAIRRAKQSGGDSYGEKNVGRNGIRVKHGPSVRAECRWQDATSCILFIRLCRRFDSFDCFDSVLILPG